MYTALLIVMILAGIALSASILLMSPKGGLGAGIAGIGGGGDFGARKGIEKTLTRSAQISGLIFLICVLILPYLS